MSFTEPHREILCSIKRHGHSAEIRCHCAFGPRWKQYPCCKVDTGAGLTLIPRWIWQEEFPIEEILSLPDHPVPVTTVGNVRLACKAGPREIAVFGQKSSNGPKDRPRSSVESIVRETMYLGECHVLYNLDPQLDRPYILLGLGGGTLDGGGLCINWNHDSGQPRAVFVEQLPPFS